MIPLYERAFTNFLFSSEMLCASLLFFQAYRKKKGWLLVFLLGLMVLGGATLLLRYAEDLIVEQLSGSAGYNNFLSVYFITLLSNLLLTGLVILIISAIYRTTLRNILFIAIAASATRVIARSVFFLAAAAQGLRTSHIWDLLFREPFGVLSYLLINLLVFSLTFQVFIRNYRETEDDLLPPRILIPTCIVVILGSLFANVNAPREETEYIIYLFLLLSEILISVLILILQFFALGWLRLQLQNAAMEQLYESQQRQFTLSQESMDAVNMNAHDLKHKVKAIIGALDGDEQPQLRSELADISEAISEWDSIYHTGCKPLDVVLTEKAQICRKLEAELSVIADGACISSMSEIDIYSLFSNALDNSIEAVSKIPEPEKRLIIVSITEQNHYAVIRIENTFQDMPTFVNGTLATSKEDKLFHGFGVRSIENTIKKYGGHMDIDVMEKLFCLILIFPCENI